MVDLGRTPVLGCQEPLCGICLKSLAPCGPLTSGPGACAFPGTTMHVLDLIAGWLMDLARWLVILVLSIANPAHYTAWTGTVVEIVRPHEIKVMKEDGKTAENIRLYGIHCPLGNHPFAKEARAYASNRLLHRKIVVQPLPGKVKGPWYHPETEPRDAYGRIVALVSLDGDSVSKDMLRNGIAWWYAPLVPFERGFKRLEDIAREEKKGLWAFPNPAPSWNFKSTPVGATNPFQKDILAQEPAGSPALPKPKQEKNASEQAPSSPERSGKEITPIVPTLPVPEPRATGLPSGEQPSKAQTVDKPEEKKNECNEQEYLVRLKRAYRAVKSLVASYTYICRQIGMNWEQRSELAGLYQLNPEQLVQAEQLLKEADRPCPGSVQAHEQVQELWSLGTGFSKLARAETDDQASYESQLMKATQRSDALMNVLNAVLAEK